MFFSDSLLRSADPEDRETKSREPGSTRQEQAHCLQARENSASSKNFRSTAAAQSPATPSVAPLFPLPSRSRSCSRPSPSRTARRRRPEDPAPAGPLSPPTARSSASQSRLPRVRRNCGACRKGTPSTSTGRTGSRRRRPLKLPAPAPARGHRRHRRRRLRCPRRGPPAVSPVAHRSEKRAAAGPTGCCAQPRDLLKNGEC